MEFCPNGIINYGDCQAICRSIVQKCFAENMFEKEKCKQINVSLPERYISGGLETY